MAPDIRHSHILDNLRTAILVVQDDLTVGYMNPAAEALLDISGSRVFGGKVGALFREPDASCPISERLRMALRDNAAFTQREVVLMLLPSGQRITVDYAVTPVHGDDEDERYLVLELQPLDRLLRISRDEGILSSQQNTRALVRGLAHEIKNPLGGLRGAAQLLARELPEASSLRDYTTVIIEEADRLRKLVDRMLGPHKALDLRRLNLHEVVERVRQLLEAETGGSVRFVRDYDPSIPELMADKEQLIQAVLNIVRNAVEALGRRDETAEPATIVLRTRTLRQCTIGTRRHRLVAKIEITDNGPGIDPELVETIFLPMVSGRPEGTGLGLSIAQSIVNRHQGLIECSSRPGCTTFALYIPLDV